MTSLSMIVAIDSAGTIGNGDKLPWPHLPSDFRSFKALTNGGRVIMGRKTWESLPEKAKPLPGRANVILSTQNLTIPQSTIDRLVTMPVTTSVNVAGTLEDALDVMPSQPGWVIGGVQVYKEALAQNLISRAVITVVDGTFEGDVKLFDYATLLQKLRESGGTWACQNQTTYTENGVTYQIFDWLRS